MLQDRHVFVYIQNLRRNLPLAKVSKTKQDDLSATLEVCEPLEEFFGIRLDALSGRIGREFSFVPSGTGKYLHVCGEVHPFSGTSIKSSFQLIVAVYDSEGRVIASCDVDPPIEPGRFFGFESFSAEVCIPTCLLDCVSKILIYPSPY